MLVGAGIVASRFVLAEVPPLTLAMLRYTVGFLCLLPFAWTAIRRPPPRDLLAMAALGIGQFGVLIALLNYGLQHVGAAQAAMIFSLFPLLTLLLAAAMGRESLSPGLLLCVLLSVAGVALSLLPKLGAGPVTGVGGGGWGASWRSRPLPAPERCAVCCTGRTWSAIPRCRSRPSRCWPRSGCWPCWR